MTKRIYLYPITSRGKDDAQNPYIYNLATQLNQKYNVININKPSNNGIVQIFQLFFKIDIVYLNWIENLPDRKHGKVQSFILLLLLLLLKLFRKKIVWTMHNKISHSNTNIRFKRFLFLFLLKHADIVITHSKEGITYSKSLNVSREIAYFPHPVLLSEKLEYNKIIDKKYDILIWGLMTPYKGVANFLQYLSSKKIANFKILIAGKFNSEDYYNEVRAFETPNITIINSFIEKEKLPAMIEASKIVLFTYENASVLSSGVLADTLVFNSIIIGPLTGSFADLREEKMVYAYANFEELVELLQSVINTDNQLHTAEQKEIFLKSITWKSFANWIEKYLN